MYSCYTSTFTVDVEPISIMEKYHLALVHLLLAQHKCLYWEYHKLWLNLLISYQLLSATTLSITGPLISK